MCQPFDTLFKIGPLVARAALYTAVVVGGLSLTAACAPSEKYLYVAGPLSVGLGVIVVASLGKLERDVWELAMMIGIVALMLEYIIFLLM